MIFDFCLLNPVSKGRLIDLIKKKGTNLQRVTYLVFDEADRMFDMGFEPQVRSIANHVRPGRQTLLFSATFKKKVEKLAREILIDPIRIIQGELGEANENITQIVHVFNEGVEKWKWLTSHLVEFTSGMDWIGFYFYNYFFQFFHSWQIFNICYTKSKLS